MINGLLQFYKRESGLRILFIDIALTLLSEKLVDICRWVVGGCGWFLLRLWVGKDIEFQNFFEESIFDPMLS